ncbi:MAG: folate-binding protein [Alphaproteobacteria bacterium]|nr:folate-binding protein [Alphaproteobacteria bacterium]
MTWLGLDRAIVRASGADAASFLDNLITQDVEKLARAACFYGGLLTPQGKVSADFLIWPDGDGFLLETAPAFAADLMRKLTLYRLRAKVEITAMDWRAAACFGDEPAPPEGLSAPDPRLPGLGRRWIGPGDGFPNQPEAALAARVAAGVPDLAADAGPEEVFALEALFEELNGVAFDKGCFVGQENVSRMKRRATTRKKFCPIATEGHAPFGTPLLADGVEIGTTRSAIPGRALALLRLDRALAATRLEAGGAPARLDPPTWLIPPKSDDAP